MIVFDSDGEPFEIEDNDRPSALEKSPLGTIVIEPQLLMYGTGAILENGVEVGRIRIQPEDMTTPEAQAFVEQAKALVASQG